MKLNNIINSILSRCKQFKYALDVKKAKKDVELMIKDGVLKRTQSENSEFITGYFTIENKDSPQ